MSHTEVYDPRTQYRSFSDELNRTIRHCRIGKIRWKRTPYRPFAPLVPMPVYDEFTFKWPQIYKEDDVPAMCRQCVGKACGNVACPKRTVVTC